MISTAFGVVTSLLALQAAVNAPRQAFTACLKQASQTADARKISSDQYAAHVKQACSAQANSFREALVAFDVKNGIKRAQASEDAQLQLDDYYLQSTETYEMKHPAAPTPQPQQASAPQQPSTPQQPQ